MICGGCNVTKLWEHRCHGAEVCWCRECRWPEVRERLVVAARKSRQELVGIDDFDGLRKEVAFNYVLDAAKEYFAQMAGAM